MDLSHLQAERDRDVAVLVAQATPDSLAAAAWLAQPLYGEETPEKSLELIERAETLAPDRPELVWLHRAICERAMCDMNQLEVMTVDAMGIARPSLNLTSRVVMIGKTACIQQMDTVESVV
jgi:hypothetical protein